MGRRTTHNFCGDKMKISKAVNATFARQQGEISFIFRYK